jgi:hypothetical protein
MHEAPKRNRVSAKSYIFNVAIEEDAFDDGRPAFHASVPALKGCHTWGSTYTTKRLPIFKMQLNSTLRIYSTLAIQSLWSRTARYWFCPLRLW